MLSGQGTSELANLLSDEKRSKLSPPVFRAIQHDFLRAMRPKPSWLWCWSNNSRMATSLSTLRTGAFVTSRNPLDTPWGASAIQDRFKPTPVSSSSQPLKHIIPDQTDMLASESQGGSGRRRVGLQHTTGSGHQLHKWRTVARKPLSGRAQVARPKILSSPLYAGQI